MVMRRCLWLAVAGVVPGIALAYAAGRSMEALLAGVKPADAVTLGSAVALVGGDDGRRQRHADAARAARRSDHGDPGGVVHQETRREKLKGVIP